MENLLQPKKYQVTGALIRAAIVSSLGGLLFGFDTAVIAGTTSSVKTIFQLSEWAMGFVVSSALIGTIVGTIISSKPGDIWGRRNYLMVLAALFLISAIGCALAWDFWSLAVFRFIGGIAIGGSSVIIPMYLAEIAPAKLRGRLVILFQFNVCLGILVAYFSNAMIEFMNTDVLTVQWRLMFATGGVPALLFLIMLFTIPDSPRWLIAQGRTSEAKQVLSKMGELQVNEAFSEIQQSLITTTGTSQENLFQRKYFYPIFLGVSVAAFNQLSFVNGFLYYLNDTLHEIGASFGGKFQPILIGVANVLAVTVALMTIDRIGRKKLLLIGSWGSAIPLALCAYIAWTRNLIELFPWGVALFILFFSFSQGAVIWVYISEVFPNKVRSKGQALGSFTHWGLCAIAAQVYPPLVASSSVGLAIPFIFGGVMMVLQFFVVWFFFVETKGVPLEQLEMQLGVKLNAPGERTPHSKMV
ncbi:sugar porter family MFS transporter [Adhaeribacter pallidiroseus]|uniref:Solute carrier family 2, facilitated glucose transporter member n=1 Tax=Adhaeribacter pallidiroseus TaxID=2072847 RepID=A0A369QCM8_9BACT|nr:sugar porter family MFS transporter [Adhaeribacter pallidiroseus]RDC62653.1 Solute carrier family 2, facilitated glucose transporter member [Adhaeribacter pallidiroseus]